MIREVLTFYLQKRLWGINIEEVKELNRKISYTPVMGAAREIAGLLNLRGQVVTLFHLDSLMGIKNEGAEPVFQQNCIILRNKEPGADTVGFLVEGFGEVYSVTPEMNSNIPANMDLEQGQYIKGMIRLKERILPVVGLDILQKGG